MSVSCAAPLRGSAKSSWTEGKVRGARWRCIHDNTSIDRFRRAGPDNFRGNVSRDDRDRRFSVHGIVIRGRLSIAYQFLFDHAMEVNIG